MANANKLRYYIFHVQFNYFNLAVVMLTTSMFLKLLKSVEQLSWLPSDVALIR